MSNKGNVLRAQDNKVAGASEGNLTPNTTSTTVSNVTYDIPALLQEHKTRSGVIRYLASQGLKTNQIHKILKDAGWRSHKDNNEPIRYQHVRNVLTQPLKKQTAEAPKAAEPAKSAT